MAEANKAQPLLSETYLDAPSQRLIAVGLGVVLQARKIWDVLEAYVVIPAGQRTWMLWKWACIDALFFLTLPFFRIPRLNFSMRVALAQLCLMVCINYAALGDWHVPAGIVPHPESYLPWIFNPDQYTAIAERKVTIKGVVDSSAHLLGQHTVRLSPINTAKLNPRGQSYCLAPHTYNSAYIPIVFNNSQPHVLQFSISPLGDKGPRTYVNVTRSDLHSIESTRTKLIAHTQTPAVIRPRIVLSEADEWDQLDDDDSSAQQSKSRSDGQIVLSKSERLAHIRVVQAGVVRLERVLDKTGADFRIKYSEVVVVECPSVGFVPVDDAKKGKRCVGDAEDASVRARGVAPLELKWGVDNCEPGKDILVRKGHASKNLIVKARTMDDQDGWGAHISFTPEETAGTETPGIVGKVMEKLTAPGSGSWTKFFPASPGARTIEVPVSEPGTYSLVRVAGELCEGVVRAPEVCRVVEVPLPKAEVEVKRIHECSGDVGIHTIFTMDGTPPFRIHYTTTDHKGTSKSQETYLGARGELTLQPNKSGTYTYSFDAISDAFYSQVPLTGPGRTVTQVVHPLASARFREASADVCGESREIEVGLEMQGVGPWKVEMQVGSELVKFERLKKEMEVVKVGIPKEVYARGGKVGLDLVSVEDGNGCKRMLSLTQMSVEVRRVKPTARFYSQDGKHRVTVPHGSEAVLPLRFTGDGRWYIEYRAPGSRKVHKQLLRSANDQLSVSAAGTYELVSVSDSHCPGTIVPEGAFYTVDWIPLPAVGFAPSAGVFDKDRSVIVRPPVCAGEEDHAEVDLIGKSCRPPFQVTYTHTDPKSYSEDSLFTSLKNLTRLAMRTNQPGTHVYALQHLADATYNTGIGLDTRRTRGLRLEQEVYARPSARFKSAARISRCLNTDLNLSFEPGAVLALSGTPPFTLSVAVQNLAEDETHHAQIVTNDHEWAVNVPDYVFRTIGPHVVDVKKVRDASMCAEVKGGGERLWVDVAETAAIIPLERRVDYCVGDVLNFQLEGTAPWQIGYTFNGKHTLAKSSTSRFSRVAAQPGLFTVESIAHQQNYCKTAVRDVEMRIHELPTARVSDGNRVIEDIREGDQAEIVFKLKEIKDAAKSGGDAHGV
ncbi:hypothetical protein FRC08_002662 [Ceratobasidium sp. 394]|nr:hypothetical protein FRC08_002662 [Ceratobasidium sp. 394]